MRTIVLCKERVVQSSIDDTNRFCPNFVSYDERRDKHMRHQGLPKSWLHVDSSSIEPQEKEKEFVGKESRLGDACKKGSDYKLLVSSLLERLQRDRNWKNR